jgi:hypothetical protein
VTSNKCRPRGQAFIFGEIVLGVGTKKVAWMLTPARVLGFSPRQRQCPLEAKSHLPLPFR